MNERIKLLRKTLDLTQREFANKLGMKQNTIATYEMGRSNPSEPTIAHICKEFNVNETWLRTGDGEMFKQITRADAISDFIHDTLSTESDTFQKRFIAMLSRLNTTQWEALEEIALMLTGETPQPQTNLNIESELSSYRRELELEKTAKEKSEASPDSKEA